MWKSSGNLRKVREICESDLEISGTDREICESVLARGWDVPVPGMRWSLIGDEMVLCWVRCGLGFGMRSTISRDELSLL